MSPEKAKIFLVDDDDDIIRNCSMFLEKNGHNVVEVAGSLQEALLKIPTLAGLKINVAVVDGNLSGHDASGDDGEIITEKIKSQNPNIKVIGHSLDTDVRGADVNCRKVEGLKNLSKTVTRA